MSRNAALFLALLAPALVRAADSVVQVVCPGLSGEQVAEVESRVRANLLTLELSANVAISCEAGVAKVSVEAAGEGLDLEAALSSSTTLDDLVSAADQALEQLLGRRAASPTAAPVASQSSPAPVALQASAPLVEPLAPTPASPADRRERPEPARPAAATEVATVALGESWQDRFALGGGLGIARRTRSFWYGLHAGALAPLGESASFDALECHASLELGWQPRWAAGARLGLGFGPSVLLVTPSSGLTSQGNTSVMAFFAALELNRVFRFGSLGFAPSIGARLFASERGVRVDGRQRLLLSGLVPTLGLGLAYVAD